MLSAEELARGRELLARADWADGRITAGSQSAQVKRNLQLPQQLPEAQQLQAMVEGALQRNGLFFSAALPAKIFRRCSAATRPAWTSATMWTTRCDATL